ncbi:MAG: hypothetical protein M5U33_09455 [Pseudorhodoplanes sp.]|nr:hypothetical protein [Pseudorhodoplanes sp.]
MTITVLGVIVALGTAGAQAQSAPEAVRTLAGNWEISNADRDRVCTVTLKPDAARTGFRLELDPAWRDGDPRSERGGSLDDRPGRHSPQ